MLEVGHRATSRFSPQVAVVCFSHLRWDFVFQRPQHVMTRFAREHPVFFIEEPVRTISPQHGLYQYEVTPEGVHRIIPLVNDRMEDVVDEILRRFGVRRFVSWYYTPAALEFTNRLAPEAVIYDCMDQLSAFKDADPRLPVLESRLLAEADVVFAGGRSLY